MIVTSFAPVQAIYCFDPADRALCESLDRHLAPLKQVGRIQTWDERHVLAGSEWERERNRHFSAARLLLLLLSPDFLASEMGQQQIQMALQRHQAGDAVVLPLLLRSCAWEETELRSLHILPGNHEPLTLQPNGDKAWQEVVGEMIRMLETLQQRVYLVFAPEDQMTVEPLLEDLPRCGLTVSRLKGDPFSSEFPLHEMAHEAIRQASCVLLMASPATFSSRVVKAQLEVANDYQRSLYVLWVNGEDTTRLHAGPWQAEAVLDASDQQRYEEAKVRLLSHFKQPRAATPALTTLLPVAEPRNPYKGLHAFTAQDVSDFFGRNTLVNELATTLEQILVQEKRENQQARLLAVLGASGSGKTSVLLAGLLPQLQQGGVFNSREWIYLNRMVPGTHPLEALAVAFAQQPALDHAASLHAVFASDSLRTLHLLALQLAGSSARKVVLFIDQFEEVFTLTTSEEERKHFFDLLQTAVTEPQGPLLVIVTLRADFSDRAMQYPALYRLLNTQPVSVLPMERDELRQMIEAPSRLPDVQLTFEGDLVGDLLFDMREDVSALPLLEFTLDQLFARRNGHLLTLHAYRDIGGVKGALAKHAETTYDALPTKEHQELARSLFLRLIDPGRTEQDTIRRRARLSEFERPDATQTRLLRETMDAFVTARLLTTNENEQAGEATVEVSHEALIREWPRLIGWLPKAREDIRLQQKISEDAAAWQQRGSPNDRLYRGTQLKEALAWQQHNLASVREHAFVHRSQVRRIRERLGLLFVALLLFGLLAPAGVLAFQQFAPLVVTTSKDDAAGSLRQMIESAKAGSTILLPATLTGPVVITHTLTIGKNLTILGPATHTLEVVSRFQNETAIGLTISITHGVNVLFSDLTFTAPSPTHSPFFENEGQLILQRCILAGITLKTAASDPNPQLGAAISNVHGTLTIRNSTITRNSIDGEVPPRISSIFEGGAIDSQDGTVNITDTQITANAIKLSSTGAGIGGAIAGLDTTFTLTNTTISGNSISGGGGVIGITGTGAAVGAGGFEVDEGSATLTNCMVGNNVVHSKVAMPGKNGNNVVGGGIAAIHTIFKLNRSTVQKNTLIAPYNGANGGGIYAENTSLLLTDSTIADNTVTSPNSAGGGIGGPVEVDTGMITLTRTTVTHNTVTATQTGFGGGIGGKEISLTESEVSHNAVMVTGSGDGTGAEGGGVFAGVQLTIIRSSVDGNTATADQTADGGGISGGKVSLTGSEISHNTVMITGSGNGAGAGGGGISAGTQLTITRSTVDGNTATAPQALASGGGIEVGFATSTLAQINLINCTIAGNSVAGSLAAGGGLLLESTSGTIDFCTISGNEAPDGGGGIFLATENNIQAFPLIKNTLIAQNQANMAPDVFGSFITGGYNLIQHFEGTDFLDPDQRHTTDHSGDQLATLGIDAQLRMNGGFTPTLALLLSSPAINQIPPAACDVPTDQRGVKRPQQAKCDIGAYEYAPF